MCKKIFASMLLVFVSTALLAGEMPGGYPCVIRIISADGGTWIARTSKIQVQGIRTKSAGRICMVLQNGDTTFFSTSSTDDIMPFAPAKIIRDSTTVDTFWVCGQFR